MKKNHEQARQRRETGNQDAEYLAGQRVDSVGQTAHGFGRPGHH